MEVRPAEHRCLLRPVDKGIPAPCGEPMERGVVVQRLGDAIEGITRSRTLTVLRVTPVCSGDRVRCLDLRRLTAVPMFMMPLSPVRMTVDPAA